MLIDGVEVRVTVISVKDDEVQLAIKAPDHLKVYRQEIYRRIQREREAGITRPKAHRGFPQRPGRDKPHSEALPPGTPRTPAPRRVPPSVTVRKRRSPALA